MAVVSLFTNNTGLNYLQPGKLAKGFTLIELLVVLVVMGIALGMVTLQLMPDDRAILREESQRLALLLENAGLQARASGRPLAWSVEKNGYLFWSKNEYGEWIRIETDPQFHPRTLPEGIGISEISVESETLKTGDLLALNAFSFTLPFSIKMTAHHAEASVTGDSTGVVTSLLSGG